MTIYYLLFMYNLEPPLNLPLKGETSPSPTGEGWGEAVPLPFRGGLGRGCLPSLQGRVGERLSPSPTGEGWGEAVSLPFRGGLGRGFPPLPRERVWERLSPTDTGENSLQEKPPPAAALAEASCPSFRRSTLHRPTLHVASPFPPR